MEIYMAFLAIAVTVGICAILCPIVWMIAFHEPKRNDDKSDIKMNKANDGSNISSYSTSNNINTQNERLSNHASPKLNTDTINEIIRSVDSLCNKSLINNEHKRALLNKKNRASNIAEYIESLIANNAFYKIQSDSIINQLKNSVSTNSLHRKDTIYSSINNIGDKVRSMSKSELFRFGAGQYNANMSQDKQIECLEFDYCFASYYNALLLGAVEYIYGDDCAYLLNQIARMNPDAMAKSLYEALYRYTLKY